MTKPEWLRVRLLDEAARQDYIVAAAVLWTAFLTLLLFNVGVGILLGIEFDPSGMNRLIVPAAIAPLAITYTLFRFDPLLSSIFHSFLFLALVAPLLTAYTYVTAAMGAGMPLCDPWLAWIDHMIGFDWRSYLQLANGLAESLPILKTVATSLYSSFLNQLIAVILLLSALGQYQRLQVFCLAFVVSVLIVGAVAGVFPAAGTYDFYHIDRSAHPNLDLIVKSSHLEQYLMLRHGTFTTFSLEQAQGIVTFPSFHTTVAVLLAWAMWRVPVARWISLAVNVGMIVVTPLHGSHYLVDVIAGAAVAPAAIALANAAVRRSGERHPLLRFARRIPAPVPARS